MRWNVNPTLLLVIVAALFAAGAARAASPPDRMHYQGVLRDASDAPLDGDYDMVFRFWSAEVGGDEILVDRHVAANAQAVSVSGGLFSVELGTGEVLDGSGPGTYTTLSQVFADYGDVWLEVQVGSETLSPRIPVAAAGWALNAGRLGGRPAGEFLDTSSTSQVKSGRLTPDAPADHGVVAYGTTSGGYFRDRDGTGEAYAGFGDQGVRGLGNEAGGVFVDLDQSGYAYVGTGDRGIESYGALAGGYFKDTDQSGEASVAIANRGIDASGTSVGGRFWDSDGTGRADVGVGNRGIHASGTQAGGFFEDSDSSGEAWIAYGDEGVHAWGNTAGGYFEDRDQSGYAWVGYGENGISAYGNTAGGFFQDLNGSGWAYAGTGDYGVRGSGDTAGGYFKGGIGSGEAWAGYGDTGIEASGSNQGAYFWDQDGRGNARIGYDKWGVFAEGEVAGKFFEWRGAAVVELGKSVGVWGVGVDATGTLFAGQFSSSGTAGDFESTGPGTWTQIATSAAESVVGNGTKNFVQNHPYDPSRKIVYTALEGNEAGTYVRGSARLAGGRAVIALDETFAWVTNPDVGLTAQVTPRDECNGLRVVSVSTSELVVEELGGGTSDAAFDYLVQGLRIGFEGIPVVQPKGEGEDAPIPSMAAYRALVEQQPELAPTTPLERFRSMAAAAFPEKAAALDLSRARALVAAIHEFDPEVDALPEHGPAGPANVAREGPPAAPRPAGEAAVEEGTGTRTVRPAGEEPAGSDAAGTAPPVPGVLLLPVSVPVEEGDLLVVDPEHPGRLAPAASMADPLVVGVAAEESREGPEGPLAAVLASGLAVLKVDAGYGEIRPGDLLTSSPTPGHAMRALEVVPGTVIGKAIDGLDAGTGRIRVVLMPR